MRRLVNAVRVRVSAWWGRHSCLPGSKRQGGETAAVGEASKQNACPTRNQQTVAFPGSCSLFYVCAADRLPLSRGALEARGGVRRVLRHVLEQLLPRVFA